MSTLTKHRETINADKPELAFQLLKVAQEQYNQSLESLDHEQYLDALRVAHRKLYIEEAVLSSSEAARVVVSSSQVEFALQEIKSRYNNEDEFAEDITRVGVDESHFYQALSRELYVEAVLDLVSSEGCEVGDEEMGLFYYMNIEKFKQPEIRTARHILITINEDSDENSREKSSKKITQLAKRLKKQPFRFEEQALKHSECPTSLQGGLLGQVKRGVLYPEIESVLFKLKAGRVSEPVESPLGFHLLRCDEIQLEGVVPLKQIEEKLKLQLEGRKKKQKQRQWLQELLQKQNPSVELSEDAPHD